MKRRYAVFAVIFVVSMLIGIQAVEVVNANPIPWPTTPNTDLPILTVQTPENPSPLSNNTVTLNVTVIQPDAWLKYYMGFIPYVGSCLGYVYLDGLREGVFPSTHDKVHDFNISFSGYPSTQVKIDARAYNVYFNNLTSVLHTIRIDFVCTTFSKNGNHLSNVTQNVLFAIDSNHQTISFDKSPLSPALSLLSPVSQMYNESSVPLVFSVDKAVSWSGYSLDAKANVTVTSKETLTAGAVTNLTLGNMASGLHNITVYVNDTFGFVGASQTINFAVAKPAESFPTLATVAVVSLIGVAVVGTGLSVYYKKLKR